MNSEKQNCFEKIWSLLISGVPFAKNYPFFDPTGENCHFSSFFEKITKKLIFQKNRKKSLYISQTLIWKRIYLHIFFSFGGQVCFHYPRFCGVKKCDGTSNKTSIGICRSVIPRLRVYWEAHLVLNLLYVANYFSLKKQDSILSFRCQPMQFYL